VTFGEKEEGGGEKEEEGGEKEKEKEEKINLILVFVIRFIIIIFN
jgi:hypothetical protein